MGAKIQYPQISAEFLCGKRIGSGCFRNVFDCKLDPSLVVKISKESLSRDNVLEWDTWEIVSFSISKSPLSVSRFFAPCVSLSDDGRVLLMKKTKPCTLKELRSLVKTLPEFFTDLKVSNWGWYEDRLVCHDYGNLLWQNFVFTKKTRKAQWIQ